MMPMTATSSSGGAERRVTVRLPSMQETPVISPRWSASNAVGPRCVTFRAGIGLVLACALDPGTEVIIELPTKKLQSFQVAARVVAR